MVKAIIKSSGEMQNDLCGKRLVTPLIWKPGFSTTDGCWLFDEIEGDVRSLTRTTTCASPCHTLPATLSWNKDRVLEFLRTPFFDNAAALECQLAAVRLTLRGVSNVRAFFTVGPSGVGQSLQWQSRVHGRECVLYWGRTSKASRHLHGQGKHLGSQPPWT